MAYRVAHNAALNVARDPQAALLEELPAGLDGVERPDEVAQRRERFSRVVGAVRALPPKQRQVIVRHALDGDSHERVAADLGVSAGAIRQLAHRARRTVRKAAAGILPVPVLRWLPFGASLAESAPAVRGGAAAVKVAAGLVRGRLVWVIPQRLVRVLRVGLVGLGIVRLGVVRIVGQRRFVGQRLVRRRRLVGLVRQRLLGRRLVGQRLVQ